MKSFTHGATVTEEGRLEPHNLKSFREAVHRLPAGEYWITVEPRKTKRTLDQNAYLHAVPFPLIADYVGCSVEDIKYDLMGEKWGWKPSALDPNRMIPVMPHTSDMTVEQCSEFIDWLIPFAAEKFGMSIPYPDERAA